MSLLEEIQAAAIDSQSDLSAVLRKCKLLAARLDSKPLENWLLWESNGYPQDAPVPSYRTWPLSLTGHFSGEFGSALRNAPVPLALVPERFRSSYEAYKNRQSIAVLESLLRSGGSIFQVSTGDLNVILGSRVYQHMNCLHVWGQCGAGHFVEVLNSVRNRILDFSLAVWKESPKAGELGTAPNERLDTAQVTQIFHTTVYGGGSATLVGSAPNSSIATVVQGNFGTLREALAKQGLSAEDLNALSSAVEGDDVPTPKEKLGPKVSAWFGQMALKAAEGTLKAGGTMALKAVSEAIASYYGIKL